MSRPAKPSRPCTGPGCTREAEVGELCQSHYMQKRRGGPLRPIRGEEAAMVMLAFRAPLELKQAAQAAAAAEGIDPAEWWRRAGQAALDRPKTP